MYQNPYNYQYGYSNHMYQNPYNYPYGYSKNVYQNPYNYPYRYPNTIYQNQNFEYNYTRDPEFSEKIGTYHTIPNPLQLPSGYTLPANTRVFIHNVVITSTGEELVTIVAPIPKDGSVVSETFKDIPAKQL